MIHVCISVLIVHESLEVSCSLPICLFVFVSLYLDIRLSSDSSPVSKYRMVDGIVTASQAIYLLHGYQKGYSSVS